MTHRLLVLLCAALLGITIVGTSTQALTRAQGESTPAANQAAAGQRVEIEAADKLKIIGLFYPTTDKAPALVMLHDGVDTKKQWARYIAPFTEAGYNVLVIDQRGFGETGLGTATGITPEIHDQDAVTIATWLGKQPSVDPGALGFIGARLGANYAIRACALITQCHTVVALSAAADFFGIKTLDSLKDMTKDEALFFVAGQLGEQGAQNIKQFQADAPANLNILTRLYGLSLNYGTDMFDKDLTLMPMVLAWLKTYNHS